MDQCRRLAAADARGASDDELLRGVVAFERARSFLESAEGHWLAELDARGLTDGEHGMRTAGWVAREGGSAPPAVRQRLRVARVLRSQLPDIDAAVANGELSWDHARALALATNGRVLDAMAGLQPEIIAAARHTTFDAWRGVVRRLVAYLDHDGPAPADDPASDRVAMSVTLDGVTHLDASFTAEHGAVVRHAIEDMTDELYRRAVRDREACPDLVVPPRSRLRALALVELIRRGLALDERASRAPRAEVSLIVRHGRVVDLDGHPVGRRATGSWSCDADVSVVTVDDAGVPLDVGRQHRHATVAQRRAVAVRDGGCVFPGCEQPFAWCDVHHVDWWEQGGLTDLDNLAALCRHHHTVTHRAGWTMETTADQWFRWTTPSGQVIESQRHHRRRAGPDADEPAADEGVAA